MLIILCIAVAVVFFLPIYIFAKYFESEYDLETDRLMQERLNTCIQQSLERELKIIDSPVDFPSPLL
jgi:hypothetical protein